MEICKTVDPEYREVEPGHYCACHLYNDSKPAQDEQAVTAVKQ